MLHDCYEINEKFFTSLTCNFNLKWAYFIQDSHDVLQMTVELVIKQHMTRWSAQQF